MDEKAPWKQGQPIFPRLWFTLGQHFNFSISSWNLLLHFLVENKYFEIENLILLNLCDKILQTLKWDRTKFNTSIFSKISSTVKYGWLQVILRSWMMRVKCVTDFPYWIKSTIEWFFLSYVSFQNAPPQRSFKSSSFTVSEWLKLYFFFNQFRKKYIMMLWWRISIPPILRGWDYVWGQGIVIANIIQQSSPFNLQIFNESTELQN